VIGATCISLSLTVALTGMPVAGAPHTPAPTTTAGSRNATAIAAYAEAQELVRQRHYDQAIAQLDLASELEPRWSAPVQLRAEVFAKLAARHHPSKQFTAAQAAELQRLLELEPGVDTGQRKHEIAALQQRSKEAGEIEHRRRKLTVPAILVILSSASLLAGGAMLYSMKPREFLVPAAYREYRRDRAGIAMMATGGLLAPAAIVLGVLAFRQARRDSATRDFNVEADRPRPRPSLAVAPTFMRGGGGMGLAIRF
jgi:hypothetical protein